jgi:septum formation protein
MGNRLVLASGSPRRSELLKKLGLEFDVIPSRIEEDFIEGEPPDKHVLRLAEAKALNIGNQHPDRWIIAADTIVYIDHTILGKPKDRGEAMEMLRRLNGREHQVLTGFSVCNLKKGARDQEAVQTVVKVKTLTPLEMEWYTNTGEPFDKAGGYAVQGIGSFMIEWIRGSYTNVVGLPLYELVEMLKRLGAIKIAECGLRIAP